MSTPRLPAGKQPDPDHVRIISIRLTGEETDEQLDQMAWDVFCQTHPREAYALEPDRFIRHCQKFMPDVTLQQILDALRRTET